MNWFHRHKWYAVTIHNYTDTSYDQRVDSSLVISQCLVCGQLKEDHFYGSGPLNIENFRKVPLEFKD